MDEREEAGMRALKEGVRRAEEAGATGEGMLVCFISETKLLRCWLLKIICFSHWLSHTPMRAMRRVHRQC